MKHLEVYIRNEKATPPSRSKSTDAGLDLVSAEDVFIELGSTRVVKTGIAVKVPEGFVGKIEDRSGLASKGLRTGAGVIDAGYNGEVGVVIHNLTSELAKDPVLLRPGYQIRRGDRIAQLLLYKVETPEVVVVDASWESERGSSGFGSSGR